MSESIDELIRSFSAQVVDLTLSIERFTLREYRGNWTWPSWASTSGCYFFEQAGMVKYVGKAQSTSLRNRISSHANAFGDLKWEAVIKEPEVTVGIVQVPPGRSHFIAALEAFLTDSLRPPFNHRRS